jgi:hypothetical protein
MGSTPMWASAGVWSKCEWLLRLRHLTKSTRTSPSLSISGAIGTCRESSPSRGLTCRVPRPPRRAVKPILVRAPCPAGTVSFPCLSSMRWGSGYGASSTRVPSRDSADLSPRVRVAQRGTQQGGSGRCYSGKAHPGKLATDHLLRLMGKHTGMCRDLAAQQGVVAHTPFAIASALPRLCSTVPRSPSPAPSRSVLARRLTFTGFWA